MVTPGPVPAGATSPRGIPLPRNEWDRLDGVEPLEAPWVTVVVAHYEQQAQLDRTLLALHRQDHPASRLEIIVVDDGSVRPPRVPGDVRLIRQEDRGFRLAAARNVGLAAASGDVVCFLDADTAPERSYVRELTRLPALASDVVTVGRRRHAELGRLGPSAELSSEAPAVALPDPEWLTDAYARSRDLRDADDRSYRFVIGAVIAADAGLLRETGGFDETFSAYGGEDWEWAYRAWLRGALLAHVPAAVAWHDGPEWAGRPEAALARKNAEAQRLADLIPVPGSAGRGRPGRYADVVVSVPAGAGQEAAPWFVTLDSVAAELPLAALPGDERSIERSRIRVEARRPFRTSPGALRAAVERVSREGLGALVVVDPADGSVLCVIHSRRAEARAARWGRSDLFDSVAEAVPGVRGVGDDVDVEAYLGGWG